MYGIITLLDDTLNNRVERIWKLLKAECGLEAIFQTPVPHFTWHIAEQYDISQLEPALQELSKDFRPITVRTVGIGIFTGLSPVVYLSINKTERLIAYHQRIWRQVEPAATGSSPLYAPPSWMPHITLAIDDVDHNRLACAIHRLAPETYDWEILVDHLVLASEDSTQANIGSKQFPFIGAIER